MRQHTYTPSKKTGFVGKVQFKLPTFEEQMDYQEQMLEMVEEKNKAGVSPTIRELAGLKLTISWLDKHVESVEVKRAKSEINYSSLRDLMDDAAARPVLRELGLGLLYGFADDEEVPQEGDDAKGNEPKG